ncbi:MAG TPA: hypothetical protein VE650_00695 [Acetobacteraceae bacterium]|nr:hypothetical protein [Acetobacteraceae bacterium]
METRDFRVWAGRRHRKLFRDEILNNCRALGLQCEIRVRRGILSGGLIADVSGPPQQLDAYGERHRAMLERFIDAEMDKRHD